MNDGKIHIEIDEPLLTASRREMYRAAELFHTHFRQVISLVITVWTAIFAVFGFVISKEDLNSKYLAGLAFLAALILVALFWLSIKSAYAIGRWYRLYCAAQLFSARLHKKTDLPMHVYFEETLETQNDPVLNEQFKKEYNLLEKRADKKGFSIKTYTSIVIVFGCIGLVPVILIVLYLIYLLFN